MLSLKLQSVIVFFEEVTG